MINALKKLSARRDGDAIARAYARLFGTDDGKIVLEHLHNHVLFRLTDPQLPPASLRFLEGQRQLVLFICQMIAQAAIAKSSPSSHP